jgi:hypothetical protein
MKKGYLYLSLSVLATSFFIYLIIKRRPYQSILSTVDKKIAVIPTSTSHKKVNYEGLIVSIPNNKKIFNLIVIFGGISYATPSWMYSQVGNNILLNNLIFFAPHTMKYSDVELKIKKFLTQNGFQIVSKSVIGFSAGALNIQEVYSKDFKFFGLIDPSTKSKYVSDTFGSNTFMIYNEANWGGYPTIKPLLPILSNKINKDGGTSIKITMKHEDIPKFFFNTFENQIIK